MVKSGNKLWATSPLSLTSKKAVVMLALGAPLVLLHLCDYVAQNTAGDSPNGKRDVMLFDIFCGKQALSSAYREQGYKTLSFDVELHPRCHDITSMTGFIRGIQYTLRLAEDSLLHGGPPCGTYVWVNRATSKRSGECPDGDASVPSVANANLITSRFALLMLLALCRCCFVAAEQPRSSLMPLSTPMDHLRLVLEGILPWNVQHFWMATWGSLTAKPSMSFGIAPFAAGLYRKFTKGKRLAVQKKLKKKNLQIVKQHVDAQGRKRVTGLKDLKKTQEYPKGYGKQVLKLHRDFVAQKPGFLREHLYGDDPAPTAAHFNARQIIQNALSNDQNWLMADLGDARAFLRAERARGKFTPVFDAGLDD